MKISISDSILSAYSDYKATFIIVKSIIVEGPNEKTKQILENVYPSVKNTYNLDQLKLNPHSIAYINFAKKVGVSPDSAFLPHLQIKRVLQGKGIGNINSIVNRYMALETKYNLSFAAYDLDTLGQELVVALAKGGEEFVPIGGAQVILKQGDLVFYDEKGILYSFSEGYRNSSKVTQNTKNVLFAIDAPEGIEDDLIMQAAQELANTFDTSEIASVNNRSRSIET